MEQSVLFVQDIMTARDSDRVELKPFSVSNSNTFRHPRLSMIAVVAADGAIGKNNDLLWHLPGDLRHFKQLTTGGAVIMGRKTWESLPKKPLPGRLNIVVTRDAGYSAPGVSVCTSIEEAIDQARDYSSFIIGGGEIYRQALPFASRLYLTEVEDTVEDADTYFPAFDKSQWKETDSEVPGDIPEGTPRYRFVTYENIDNK